MSLARPGRKQANVSVRIAWISFGALPCRKKKTWWQLASRCCWNRARPWHASELFSFLVGLRTYQHPVFSYVGFIGCIFSCFLCCLLNGIYGCCLEVCHPRCVVYNNVLACKPLYLVNIIVFIYLCVIQHYMFRPFMWPPSGVSRV